MTADQLAVIRDALTGGHTGNLSADGRRKYLAALDIIDRAADSLKPQRVEDFICGAMWRAANQDASRSAMKQAAQYWATSADVGVSPTRHQPSTPVDADGSHTPAEDRVK